ncbi:hypothetical protein KY290_015200 [Solanum tuberosum]|uniref:Protein kinase domain-containing protein n=1 Tax=Solanum tuberosum TaxID=4113 RepID=A0ABQ7VRX8_SOLTU|nr:hypothetical protein KY289_015744 [Solanum tuberosum]KAH0771219.1 hypothetical protein KY290_015200 [Solanum tuberosum]
MHPYFLLFTTTIFVLIYIPGSLCQDDEQYRNCGERFRCSSMDIGYPFWGGRQPEYCGHPSFEIKCESNIPKIAIESTSYEVIYINALNRIVTLAWDDLRSSICLDNPKNASFDLNTFSYVSSDLNITLYFGCTVRPGLQLPPSPPNRLNCNSNIFGPVRIPTAAIVATACIAGLVIISVPILCCLRSRGSSCKPLISWKIESQDHKIEEFMRNYGSHAPKMYSYSDLKKITSSFSHKIGQGGFGQVYKGKLPDDRAVAVKVLTETNGDGEEYINEVASISRTSHVNIVGLLGFCYQGNRRALIYEYVSNGSLDKFLNSGPSSTTCTLEWTTLYSIAVGTARGLEYLHRGCNTRIVHFDIKPHNILLDEDFCPKISDFGLSRLCERKESILSMLGARGTAGYIAPEVFSRAFGHVSHKSDVYSYGMLVLEMVGVRNNVNMSQTSEVYFPHWIYEHLELGKDLSLQGIMNEEDEELARKMILVGLWCIQTKPSDRPAIEKAVEMLEGSVHSLQVPPKPVLNSPTRSIPESFTSTSTTTSERRFISGANTASE